MGDATDFAREKIGEISIVTAVILYVFAILSLTMFGSDGFIIGSYVGTFLLVGGFLSITGLLRTGFKLKAILIVVLFFTSAFLLVTSVNILFVGTEIHWKMTRFMGAHIANKLCMQTIRPNAFLFGVLMEVGVFSLAAAFVLAAIDRGS